MMQGAWRSKVHYDDLLEPNGGWDFEAQLEPSCAGGTHRGSAAPLRMRHGWEWCFLDTTLHLHEVEDVVQGVVVDAIHWHGPRREVVS